MTCQSAASLIAAFALGAEEPEISVPSGDRAHSHTHAHDEIDEVHGPVLVEATYTGEVIANASGGVRRGTRYLDNLDLVLEADMEALVGWRGAELHLYGLYNNGSSISELAGDAFAVSNIETEVGAFRLYEAWVDQKIGSSFSLKAGLYDLNSEFDALEASGLFVGSAHGIGADISQSGLNGPSIFPYTSLAVRLEKSFPSGVTIRAAILDAVPGDPDHPRRTAVKLNSDEGGLVIGEVDIPVGEGRLLLGHWRYTTDFETFDGVEAEGNAGTYLRGETELLQAGDTRLDGFFRLGKAAGRFNMFDVFASAGVKLTGVAAEDGEDELGFVVAHGWTSSGYRDTTGASSGETAFELTYRRNVTPFLALQPNLQYVMSPSADPAIDDAIVIGLRAEITARRNFD